MKKPHLVEKILLEKEKSKVQFHARYYVPQRPTHFKISDYSIWLEYYQFYFFSPLLYFHVDLSSFSFSLAIFN